jgi:hypothetical protein
MAVQAMPACVHAWHEFFLSHFFFRFWRCKQLKLTLGRSYSAPTDVDMTRCNASLLQSLIDAALNVEVKINLKFLIRARDRFNSFFSSSF